MSRWLALYVGKSGKPQAAILIPRQQTDFPCGVDEFAWGLADFDGEPVTLVELPDDFVPVVHDVTEDESTAIQIIRL